MFIAKHKRSHYFFHSYPKTRDLMIFCRQLAVLNTAGITLLHSLQLLAEQTEQPIIRERLQTVAARLESGYLLADSLAEHSDIFPDILLSMVKAGEEGGFWMLFWNSWPGILKNSMIWNKRSKRLPFIPNF